MTGSAGRSRTRSAAFVLVSVAFIVTEFVLLQALFHLDDGADARDRAQARAAVAVAVWRPGADDAAVAEAVRDLAGSGVADAEALTARLDTWRASGTPEDLQGLSDEVDVAGDAVADEQSTVDRKVTGIFVVLLLVVSVGWWLYFRRLVAKHRGVERELTERKAADAGERRLHALVQSSSDVVAILDPDARASYVSPAAAHVLGHDADDLLGGGLLDLVAAADRPQILHVVSSARPGRQQELQLRMDHADGRALVAEGTLTDLRDEPTVQGWVLTVRDVTERARLQEDLARQAFHDSLTGLANRQLFTDRLDHALSRRSGSPRPLAVLFVDLDDFKHVNDSLGHATGDELLVAVAARIAAGVRPGDTAARLGGDEFAVLLEDTDLTTASQLAHRLLVAVAEPVTLDGHTHTVRASVGLAEAVPGEEDGAATMRHADVAMYAAKERGKGGLAVYDSAAHERALETLTLRRELEAAVDDGALALHYQPTVDLATGAVTGFEALVRWPHPTRGVVPPLEFIPLAEQTGLIVRLGTWVLRTAVRDAASLQSSTHRPSVAVNVSARQLVHPGFVTLVRSALADSGLAPDRLTLEVTETALLSDVEAGVTALTTLRRQGVRVAIDDFGTGYSSLSHLARLPVDVLKVDKSFVDRLEHDRDDALVSAILAMSRALRLTSVAEGVEDPGQADWLREAGCALGQGYLWSRPVELETARALLAGSPGVRLAPAG
ncbi:EAL domain-containing protein [Nocardioides anomalus]|uniref:EAL domain-containing protein n=1 Tax=Nocardioides anomalus TaxID=2712223 RepID=A0A6G6WEN0_9ACTN|nr:EAL domain-containing protein [Nocardioides anomalus]QIG43684.1 EAL domain-containing protein [Nocardioides anomalus]